MTRITTMERVERSLAASPRLTTIVDPQRGVIGVRRGQRGIAWRMDFDERGRFIGGYRTDLGPGVTGLHVRTLKTILDSLGVTA